MCRRPSFAVGSSLAVLLCFACCSRVPDPVLEAVVRLSDHLLAPDPANAPERCAIREEIRPALGCPPVVVLPRAEAVVDADGSAVTSLGIPKGLRGRPLILSPLVRGPGENDWTTEPAVIYERAPASARIEIAPGRAAEGKTVLVRASARSLPPARREIRTHPIEIEPGAILRVSPGLLVLAPRARAGATDFRVHVESEGTRSELLHLELSATSDVPWKEHQVPLSSLAGKKARFVFHTAVRDVEGKQVAMDFPLWGSPEILAPRPRGQRRNVLLVSLDTVRRDHVNEPWQGVPITPEIDRIASDGTRFANAVAPYNATTASHMTLLTGVYPVLHKVTHPAHALGDEIPLLTEILARAGYTTAAFTEDAMLSAGSGFSRGFDVYRENREALQLAGSSQQTIGEGTAWLERHAREIFFLFLHTYEAHSPYEPSERQLAAFPKAPDESKGEAGRWQEVRRKYAAEVRVADDALGKLFERMAELDVLDETIVVITSDHGEELGEHGALGHAKTLFDEVLRVPLLLRAPDLIPAGAVVEEQVSLVDVVPTMLELVGLPPPGPMHGQSLVRVMRGEEDPDPVRFAEGLSGDAARTRMVTARRRDRKWIWRDDDPRHIELYDLEGDPKEEKPVDDSERQAEGAALRARYQALAGGRTRHPESDQRPIDPETARKLEALGYVE